MISYRYTEYPPGGSAYFVSSVNENIYGNYRPSEPPILIETNPINQQPIAPISPVVSQPPVPRTVTPQPPEPHGSRIYNVTVREGVKHFDGDLNLYSVEAVASAVYGWQQPQNAIGSDDAYATTSGVTGYSAELVLSNLGFQLPAGAEITGLKVTVERSKL